VKREKKSLVPTEKGLSVYEIVKDKSIADITLTGNWESRLAQIESGDMQSDTFSKTLKRERIMTNFILQQKQEVKLTGLLALMQVRH
jgi:DNA topoisomerase IA